ncbi:MAG TPA: hypothetical protein ENJ34_01845, partial [Epsilonproteobacteria bacterium]|nr:hypothetical protein [Campylobacterota bacterium]
MSSIKNILVLAPILWIRKVLLYLIIVLVGLGLLVYFLANSPLAIKKAVDTFAPDYNITYESIKGNA